MEQAARFINLLPADKSTNSTSASSSKRGVLSSTRNNRRPRNNRELESERKKLKKELDKLMKAHGKASKSLDDFNADHQNDSFPIDDKFILDEDGDIALSKSRKILQNPDIASFKGIPPFCNPDLISVWDFLCTFSRTLSLEPIELENFAASLAYKEPLDQNQSRDQYSTPPSPLYLAEAHLSLLKLLLLDPNSNEWWFSTLDTDDPTENESELSSSLRRQTEGEADHIIPTIKVDLAALLSVDEEPAVTRRWLQALEDVRSRRANAGGPIKSAIKSAISITTNSFVKAYLHKAMRKWKGNSAGFTKRSVVWLVGRVREARPDLWGRKVSEVAIKEQRNKVINDSLVYMDQLDDEPDIENVDDINFGDSDDDSESEDEENPDVVEDDYEPVNDDSKDAGGQVKIDEENTPVTSSIPVKPPPTLVDLLLPPTVPKPNTDLVSPFTWPSLVGATACRILHRYKRIRNEVDDMLRESRELNPISIAKRRRREANAASRILSECTSIKEENNVNILETAVDHLCCGNSYQDLTPVQKLNILRILVEGAYDFSSRIRECVETNIKDRMNAEKQLEMEERRAKREAKSEATKAETAARERLNQEARKAVILKKRREILRNNKFSKEFSDDHIKNLTDEEIINFDDDTRTEYESLRQPQNYPKSDVNAMVTKIHEEEAFGTNALVVLTLEEIHAREENELASMEEELASFGDLEVVYEHADRETSAKIDKLKKEISNFKGWLLTLPESRTLAISEMKEAIEDGTMKNLRAAIKSAKLALLTGDDEDSGGIWALDLMRDCALELKAAEKKKRVTEAKKDLIAKRNKCFIRKLPVGKDRFNHKFWQFESDEERVWAEADFAINFKNNIERTEDQDSSNISLEAEDAVIGGIDEEEDFTNPDLMNNEDQLKKFLTFSRQEYHDCGKFGGIVKRYFVCLSNDESFRLLIKNLDARGINESSLKNSLKDMLESSGVSSQTDETKNDVLTTDESSNIPHTNGEVNGNGSSSEKRIDFDVNKFMKSGDEEHINKIKVDVVDNDEIGETVKTEYFSKLQTAIGERVRLRSIPDPLNTPKVTVYGMGTVIGWKLDENPEGNPYSNENTEDSKTPHWIVQMDKGGEKSLNKLELIESLHRAQNKEYHAENSETGTSIFSYRNRLGRFCGRAADAPQSSSPFFFARIMLKREQEYYTPLKSRCFDNNWGGKSGARNAWIASMKEYGHEFTAIRDGLLTLENALFEFCSSPENITDSINHTFDAKESLTDEKYRSDVELESIVNGAKGLWNSEASRAIFREIMTSK